MIMQRKSPLAHFRDSARKNRDRLAPKRKKPAKGRLLQEWWVMRDSKARPKSLQVYVFKREPPTIRTELVHTIRTHYNTEIATLEVTKIEMADQSLTSMIIEYVSDVIGALAGGSIVLFGSLYVARMKWHSLRTSKAEKRQQLIADMELHSKEVMRKIDALNIKYPQDHIMYVNIYKQFWNTCDEIRIYFNKDVKKEIKLLEECLSELMIKKVKFKPSMTTSNHDNYQSYHDLNNKIQLQLIPKIKKISQRYYSRTDSFLCWFNISDWFKY